MHDSTSSFPSFPSIHGQNSFQLTRREPQNKAPHLLEDGFCHRSSEHSFKKKKKKTYRATTKFQAKNYVYG